jgi:hypothetical protein
VQKDHLEVIFEDIREKFDPVLEDHTVLGGKISGRIAGIPRPTQPSGMCHEKVR